MYVLFGNYSQVLHSLQVDSCNSIFHLNVFVLLSGRFAGFDITVCLDFLKM